MGWLPEEVYGGISGRNGNELHERLMGVIDKCHKEKLELRGGKIDLKKCFDTVAPEQAITLWEQWGAPRGVVRILHVFYQRHRRWVEHRWGGRT